MGDHAGSICTTKTFQGIAWSGVFGGRWYFDLRRYVRGGERAGGGQEGGLYSPGLCRMGRAAGVREGKARVVLDLPFFFL